MYVCMQVCMYTYTCISMCMLQHVTARLTVNVSILLMCLYVDINTILFICICMYVTIHNYAHTFALHL